VAPQASSSSGRIRADLHLFLMTSVPPDLLGVGHEAPFRGTIRGSLTEWTRCALGPLDQEPAAHHQALIRELEEISTGANTRLVVLMPPGSAKSTYASILYPAWWFTQHPGSAVIAVSHTASLGEHFGRQVRNLIAEHRRRLGYELVQGSRAAGQWRTTCRGEYFVAGVRGPITGRRADLALIDDPIKSQAEVTNARLREKLWGWFRSELLTRLKPGGRVVLVMTRWHDDDIGGRLLAYEQAEWRILRLAGFAESDDPIGRDLGAPIWPGWEDVSGLLRKRAAVGERVWYSMYQQSPGTIEGGLFPCDRIDILSDAPDIGNGRVVRAWDLASTAAVGGTDPDWTVGVKLLADHAGRYVVLDVVRLRGSPHDVVARVVATAQQDGRAVSVGLPEDPGQAGKAQVAYFSGLLTGYYVTASRETGSKMTRAMPAASQVEARNVALVQSKWNHAFLDELGDFPDGRKDDQVDAFSRAFSMLIRAGTAARRLNTTHLAR
jgi:predicted phage terminase large subunit-like protein